MTIDNLYSKFLQVDGISTDTRDIQKNTLYFALKGANFNGNKFAQSAIEVGAKYAIVDEKEFANESQGIYYVENTLLTLQNLARHHRQQLNIPVIGLTGSNGKTTTKELILTVLSKKYKVVATKGNLNNHIGVPLTLLSISPNHEFAIVEMGANHLHEIESLCSIAQPDFGYITNFGKAHLEGFGSEEGVIKGKSELYQYLKNNNKTVFVNGNDKKQVEQTKGMKKITFGSLPDTHYTFKYTESLHGNCPKIIYESIHIQSQLVGEYNANNVAAAIAIGLNFDIEINEIKTAIESYKSDNNRSQTIQLKDQEIILDAYNANPSSMEAALINFSKILNDKAIILGDMFELGEYANEEHQKIVDLAIELKFDSIFCIGNHFSKVNLPKNSNHKLFIDRVEAENYFRDNKIKETHVLIKGSRGMALEKLLSVL
ncbi:MAG: UDP-N-acetylmuramoyl-tripeptide--D-alanyl-D-alanine ligase [Moheibacter sp.]